MSEFGKRLVKSFEQAAEIAAGTAKPGTYRITQYDEDGNPHIIADFSDECLAEIEAEIIAEEAAEKQAKQAKLSTSSSTELVAESAQASRRQD